MNVKVSSYPTRDWSAIAPPIIKPSGTQLKAYSLTLFTSSTTESLERNVHTSPDHGRYSAVRNASGAVIRGQLRQTDNGNPAS